MYEFQKVVDVALISIFANHLALVMCVICEGEVGILEEGKRKPLEI